VVSVYGIGNPLMDFVAYEDYSFIKELNTQLGTMNLITEEQKSDIISKLSGYKNVPGGSCANTMRGIAWLGKADPVPKILYSGAVGNDTAGKKYTKQMDELGIITRMGIGVKPTGASIVVVTPDYDRTMFTYLGACREYKEADVDMNLLKESMFLYIAGYMWDTDNQKNAVRKAIQTAKDNGVKVSFDVADPFLVNRNRDDFNKWIPGSVDVLFGNREEIALLVQKEGEDKEIIEAAGYLSSLVVMKSGGNGCYVNDAGKITHIPGLKVKVVDTVGAGDSFASGFLYGLVKEKDYIECAVIANRLAARIVEVAGADLEKVDPAEVLDYKI
jgi:sugar/nucleoside kinase (ribokinase family)